MDWQGGWRAAAKVFGKLFPSSKFFLGETNFCRKLFLPNFGRKSCRFMYSLRDVSLRYGFPAQRTLHFGYARNTFRMKTMKTFKGQGSEIGPRPDGIQRIVTYGAQFIFG
jgi:hypothetical protein